MYLLLSLAACADKNAGTLDSSTVDTSSETELSAGSEGDAASDLTEMPPGGDVAEEEVMSAADVPATGTDNEIEDVLMPPLESDALEAGPEDAGQGDVLVAGGDASDVVVQDTSAGDVLEGDVLVPPLCSAEAIAACDDGDACNGQEGCDEQSGTCTPGVPLCDDGDPCTLDICDELQGFCDVEAIDCSDGNPCTTDSCDADTGTCVYADADCSDGDLCTEDWCAPPAGGCFWDAVNCDDGDPCTVDLCEPESGCVSSPKVCDDAIACTIDTCDASGLCTYTPDHSLCADDEVPCTLESCDALSGCISTPQGDLCGDANPCTEDSCDPLNGCQFAPVLCDDGLACTSDACLPESGACEHTPLECSDANPCNGVESCEPQSGECVAGEPVTCIDNDACDGIEVCNPANGLCEPGAPIDCYAAAPDWDGCSGAKTCQPSGVCVTEPIFSGVCPEAPDACDQSGGVDGPVSGKVTSGPSAVFVLKDQDQWEEKWALIDQIGAHWSVSAASLSSIVATELNREGGSISLDGIDCFDAGFWWNDGDNGVDYWWPQGVTGSSDATGGQGSGTWEGKNLLAVSWYHKAEEDSSTSTYKGVRISLVDLSTYDYRLLLLAEPVCEGTMVNGQCDELPTYKPLSSSSSSLHAGGIVWYQNYLYVADTSHGFRVFDLSRIQRVQTGEKNTLGYDSGEDAFYAYNYRYVIPQVTRYQHCGGACCARFSWVSLDSTTSPPSLLAGEYVSGEKSGRAHRWSLDVESGRLLTHYKAATSVATYYPAVENMQGGLSVDGHFFFSSSAAKLSWPPSLGSMHDAPLNGTLTTHQWPQLPEDLYYEHQSDQIWTCTEKPASILGETRYCFRVPRQALVYGTCD